jgi:hypothetical protein
MQTSPRVQCFDERPPCISRQRTVIQRIENTTDPLSRPRRCRTPQSTNMVAGSPGGRDPTQLSDMRSPPALFNMGTQHRMPSTPRSCRYQGPGRFGCPTVLTPFSLRSNEPLSFPRKGSLNEKLRSPLGRVVSEDLRTSSLTFTASGTVTGGVIGNTSPDFVSNGFWASTPGVGCPKETGLPFRSGRRSSNDLR